MGWGTGLSYNYCYYLNAFGGVNDGLIQVSEEDLASGKLCYIMNGNQENIYWTQNLGDSVKVQVARADLYRKQLDLKLIAPE